MRKTLLAIAALLFAASSAHAQYMDPSMVEAKGKKQQAAQRDWVMLPPKQQYCMGQALAMSSLDFEKVIKDKLSPYDPRFASQMDRCQRTTSRQLRVNFDCDISDNGRPVRTVCDEVYAKTGGRQPIPLTFEQYVGADLHGQPVEVIEMENPAARDARLRGQRPYR